MVSPGSGLFSKECAAETLVAMAASGEIDGWSGGNRVCGENHSESALKSGSDFRRGFWIC